MSHTQNRWVRFRPRAGTVPFARQKSFFAADPTRRLADGLVIAFLCCLGLVGVARVVHYSTTSGQALLGTFYVAALVAMQIAFTRRLSRELRPVGARRALLLQIVLVYLPLLHFSWWLGLPGILAGAALLALRPPASIPFFAAIVLSFAWVQATFSRDSNFMVLYGALTTVMTGLAVYGLSRLAWLARQMYAAREELARLAVAEERLRFARQLQDLLAARLSTIIARVERLRGQLGTDPRAPAEGLTEVLSISRRALADARQVASSYRKPPSLPDELTSAQSVLAATGVEVRVEMTGRPWSGPVAAVLVSALREGATNVLRHTEVQRCEIAIRETGGMAQMEIANDGFTGEHDVDAMTGGAGATAERVRELGGTVEHGPQPGGRYLLRVTVPLSDQCEPDDGPDDDRPRDRLPRVSRRLAKYTVGGVLACFGLIALANAMLENPDPRQFVVGAAVLAAILGLQLGYFSRPRAEFRPGWAVCVLLLQAAMAYGLIFAFGNWWLRTLPGFVVASALMVFRYGISVPLALGLLVGDACLRLALDGSWYNIDGDVVTTVTTALLVFGLTRLVRLVAEFHAARVQLARMAVAEERIRFARDLHDLLGLSVSAITLKAELAQKLVGQHLDKAQEQLAEITTLARKALGDVRSVAGGYLEVSLHEELRAAYSVLTSADIQAQIERHDADLPDPVGPVLAMVVREGTTNVLRHSKAGWCEITVRQVGGLARLEIVNNGVTEPAPNPDPSGGSGLRNLTYRVAAVGGTCRAGVEREDIYRLSAAIPLPA
ncbi:histidine kinase [Micromonospora yasonensis]|uniref:sensor histidine kinase n=1 Tax=Micromonospora yasonensis TaxID=1128667 RepID=UPI00222FA00C|nr:histidine kinase [Micromonospora yasonensis]MCW3842477.1 histidine kinase [Micromonospora yasonensis]